MCYNKPRDAKKKIKTTIFATTDTQFYACCINAGPTAGPTTAALAQNKPFRKTYIVITLFF